MIKEKKETMVITRRLTTDAVDLVDKLETRISKIKKSKGDYSRTSLQDITSDCIVEGSIMMNKKLDKLEK